MKDGNKIQARDDKLLKNEKSWRRARIGALILTVVWALILYTLFKPPHIMEREGLFAIIGCIFFWLLILDWLNMRIRHIDSIKYYRNKLTAAPTSDKANT